MRTFSWPCGKKYIRKTTNFSKKKIGNLQYTNVRNCS